MSEKQYWSTMENMDSIIKSVIGITFIIIAGSYYTFGYVPISSTVKTLNDSVVFARKHGVEAAERLKRIDYWGNKIFYEKVVIESKGKINYLATSAGRDGLNETSDDIIRFTSAKIRYD